jgi:phosphate transport system permease protein
MLRLAASRPDAPCSSPPEQRWSPGFNQPTSSLPVMIYTYAIAPYEDWHNQAWAAGLVLLALVLLANIGARLLLGRRFHTAG